MNIAGAAFAVLTPLRAERTLVRTGWPPEAYGGERREVGRM